MGAVSEGDLEAIYMWIEEIYRSTLNLERLVVAVVAGERDFHPYLMEGVLNAELNPLVPPPQRPSRSGANDNSDGEPAA